METRKYSYQGTKIAILLDDVPCRTNIVRSAVCFTHKLRVQPSKHKVKVMQYKGY